MRRSYCLTAKTTKLPKSRKARSVPMADEVMAALDKLSQRTAYTDPGDLVFPAWDGGPDSQPRVLGAFRAALRAAGMGNMVDCEHPFRFHDLRHTFGTLAATKLPITAVQALMGHASMQTTMIYAHYARQTTRRHSSAGRSRPGNSPATWP